MRAYENPAFVEDITRPSPPPSRRTRGSSQAAFVSSTKRASTATTRTRLSHGLGEAQESDAA